MYKLAVLLFLTATLAKIKNPKYDYILFEHTNSVQEVPALRVKGPARSGWVVSLNNDMAALKLRAASAAEVDEVFPASRVDSGPSRRQGRRLKKDDPNKPQLTSPHAVPGKLPEDVDEKAMLSEIMRIINKFVLTTNTEPEVYLPEHNDDGPTLKLYFKGAQTSLVVKAEGRRWHYIIAPPTLFPEWFYEDHTTDGHDSKGNFVDVPKIVKMEFYRSLFHMLTMFLSFPV